MVMEFVAVVAGLTMTSALDAGKAGKFTCLTIASIENFGALGYFFDESVAGNTRSAVNFVGAMKTL